MERDASSRQMFDTLRARLSTLSEALFDKAPYTRRSTAGTTTNSFGGSGSEIVTLCRGVGAVDAVLRQFEQTWDHLRSEDRYGLWDEWDIRLDRLYKDARERCTVCLVAPGAAVTTTAAAYDCSVCSLRVVHLAEEMEMRARKLSDTLNILAPEPSNMPSNMPSTSPDPTPALEPAPEPALPVVSEAPATPTSEIKLKDERIRELEAKCQEYSELLEQTQNALENLNGEVKEQEEATKAMLEELDALRKAKKELQAANILLEQDIKEATEGIEKYAEDLDELMRWQTAQVAYAQLHGLLLKEVGRLPPPATPEAPDTEQRRKELEIKSLRLRHRQSVALMRLGRHQEAEAMCVEVWEKRELLRAETSRSFIRNLVKDYCDMLVRNGKHDVAEREYQLILWNELHASKDREDEKDRFIIYSRLGDIKTEQKKHMEAAMLHKDALDKIMQLIPLDVELAAECAVKCLTAQRMQDEGYVIVDNLIGKHLETIWISRRENAETPCMLTCGHEHGIRLLSDGKDEDSMTVLLAVWERRKSLASDEQHRPGAMDTALTLVDLSVKTENLARLETLYHWITQNPTAEQTESDRLWSRYRLGCVQAVLQKYVIAGQNLRKAMVRHRDVFGRDDPDTMQYTQLLAEILRRERRTDETVALVREMWEGRQRLLHARAGALQAVLRTGHVYGDVLAESHQAKDLAAAEAVLKEVWDVTSSNLSALQLSGLSLNQLSGLVSSGDCYAFVLMKRNKFAAAKAVLAAVLEWKRWPPLGCAAAAVERTEYLLKKSGALLRKESVTRKHVKYQPSTVHYHPLQLRYLLDRWYSASAVTGYITHS